MHMIDEIEENIKLVQKRIITEVSVENFGLF
jgi:hypothetical protein